MYYDEAKDMCICKNGRELPIAYIQQIKQDM